MEAKMILLVVASFHQLFFTLADDLFCNVTQTPQGTLYQVQQTAANQEFFWENETRHTLAQFFESIFNKTNQVLDFSATHLHLPKCREVIFFSSIDDEGMRHTARCNTTCIEELPEPAWRERIGLYCSLGLLLVLLLALAVGEIVSVCRKKGLQDQLCNKLGFNKVPKEDDLEAARC